jgi:hypothetical protein
MKRLVFICLIAAVHAQEEPKPPSPLPEASAREATREEAQQRLGELMAFAATTEVQWNAMRRELAEKEMARDNRKFSRNKEINDLAKKSEAGDEAATKRIAELRKEKEADDAAWEELKGKQSAIDEKLEPWNREFELAAGSVLKGRGALESGAGLNAIKANLGRGSLVYRWLGSAEGGKPELEVRLGFRPMPPDVLAHFGNPTRKIGGTGTVIIEREQAAAVIFEKFQMEVELGHWEKGAKSPLEVATQAIDFDALGALKVAMVGAEPSKLDRTLPRLSLEVKRPPASTLPREEQIKAFASFFKEALELKKKVSKNEAEEREEGNRLSLRQEELGMNALSDEMDRLRRKERAGEAFDAEAYAELKAKLMALIEKENAPLRAIGDRKLALLREAELKHPQFEAVAASILVPSASLPDGVGLAKIDARLKEGVVWLHWDTMPESKQSAVMVFLKLFHRPDGFEGANPVKGMIQDKWPVVLDGPNNVRIWLKELMVDVSVSPEWQARGIKPKDLAESLLDFEALGELDAAAAGEH